MEQTPSSQQGTETLSQQGNETLLLATQDDVILAGPEPLSYYLHQVPNNASNSKFLGPLKGSWQAWEFAGKIDRELESNMRTFKQFIIEGLGFFGNDAMKFYVGMIGKNETHAFPTIVAICITKQSYPSSEDLKRLYYDFPAWTSRNDRYNLPHTVGFMILALHGDLTGFLLDGFYPDIDASGTSLEPLNSNVIRAWQDYTSRKKSETTASPLKPSGTSNPPSKPSGHPVDQTNLNTSQNLEQLTSKPKKDQIIPSQSKTPFLKSETDKKEGKIAYPLINPPNYFPKIFLPLTYTSGYKEFFRPRIWSLDPASELEWSHIKSRIEMLIRHTPASSKGKSTPIVIIQGFIVGPMERLRYPTVLINSNSPAYARELQKAIIRSTILDGTQFKTLIVEGPIDTDPVETEGLVGVKDDNTSVATFRDLWSRWSESKRRKGMKQAEVTEV